GPGDGGARGGAGGVARAGGDRGGALGSAAAPGDAPGLRAGGNVVLDRGMAADPRAGSGRCPGACGAGDGDGGDGIHRGAADVRAADPLPGVRAAGAAAGAGSAGRPAAGGAADVGAQLPALPGRRAVAAGARVRPAAAAARRGGGGRTAVNLGWLRFSLWMLAYMALALVPMAIALAGPTPELR